ncbi:MAG TPA: DUF2971 domain-containing protein, partial [Polyangiaceae bacterium]
EILERVCCEAIGERRKSCGLPARLYHLTDIDGFTGIVRTKQLWASLATDLNDASEINYGWSLVRNALRDRAQATRDVLMIEGLRQLDSPFNSSELGRIDLHPVVVSFCERCDRSGQWLHYGKSGHGIAIGFDSRLAELMNLELWKVNYDPQSQRRDIDDYLSAVVDAWKGFPACQQADPCVLHESANALLKFLSFLVISMKHPAFREEEEWRLCGQILVRNGQIDESSQVRYRMRNDHLVPYESLSFREMSVVCDAVIGYSNPTSEHALKLLLRANGCLTEVRRSEVPVR